MPKSIDISVGISKATPIYPGDPPFRFGWDHRIGKGRRSNLSFISLGSHTGSHIDAPLHFLPGGKTIDQLPLESLVGPCRVVEIKNPREITARDLPNLKGIERILFKTQNSARRLLEKRRFAKDFVALTPEAARVLTNRKIKLVGIDYLSVEKFRSQKPLVHWTLLKAGVVVVEGLNLLRVAPGNYELICLPLKVVGAEGAPVRALLKKN